MHILWQRFKATLFNKQGFTLVELLMVVALLGIVMAIPIQALFLTNRDWQYNQAMSPALMDGNLFFSRLGSEIRSADKPEGGSKSVDIDNNQLIIFRPAGTEWERVEYRLNDTSQVQRGTFTGSASQVLDRDNNSINNWDTIVYNVSLIDFSDADPGSTADRRLIQVSMQLSDSSDPPRFQPFLVESNFLSRSQQSGSGTGGGGTSPGTISVTRVVLSKTSLELQRSQTASLQAMISPANATNKTVSWSSSNTGVATVSGSGSTATVTAVGSGNATITVTTADGGKTAQCYVTVSSSGCY
ncbi:MAG: Ig-like domain-containing protein [Syntrophomonadaceae bacterium]|jgi:prepilin-type N-terminal cleavage/methylation domain-containing protein